MLVKRLAVSENERLKSSWLVLENLESLDRFRQASNILFYLSLEEEVRTDEIISRASQTGQRVYVPLSCSLGKIHVTRIPGMSIEFEKRAFGIREPKKEFWDICDPCELDLVIVPGLAFDLCGGRIGFGAGFFDRFLTRLKPNVVFIGLAFDFQIVNTTPQSENDRRVHFIVTEKRIHDCRHSLMN